MKKLSKGFSIALGLIVLSNSVFYAEVNAKELNSKVIFRQSNRKISIKLGFNYDRKGKRYFRKDGTYPKSQWEKIDGKWYYFDAEGYAVLNKWQGNYYLGKDGVMLVNTTTPDGYRVDENGKWIKGWRKNSTGWWYENSDGSYPENKWQKIDGKWYYFGKSGYMVVNKWQGSYYLGKDGAMLINTTTPDGYRVDESGKWVKGWRKNSTGWWYQNSDGSYPENKWQKIDGKWYYFGKSGYMVVNRWQGNYYLGKDGAMLINTTTPDGHRVDENGKKIPQISQNQSETVEEEMDRGSKLKSLISKGLSKKEAELYLLINEYRKDKGLKKLKLSKSLTKVARTHVKDSNMYQPENGVDSRGKRGNLHSWSPNGNWTPVVYTPDHLYGELMWSKPRELTNYRGNGYEISYKIWGASVTPEYALTGWKKSKGHNDIITAQGYWDTMTVMGVGIDGNYSHVWFGVEEDPDGYYD